MFPPHFILFFFFYLLLFYCYFYLRTVAVLQDAVDALNTISLFLMAPHSYVAEPKATEAHVQYSHQFRCTIVAFPYTCCMYEYPIITERFLLRVMCIAYRGFQATKISLLCWRIVWWANGWLGGG